MSETTSLSVQARATIDQYLDAVEDSLRQSGIERSERLTVCEDLMHQILDQLERQGGGRNDADVRAVLAGLDPPEAYAGEQGSASADRGNRTSETKTHPLAIAAAATAFGGAALLVLSLTWIRSQSAGIAVLICFALLVVLSALMGAEAIRQMRREPGRWTGFSLAFSPMALVAILSINAITVTTSLLLWNESSPVPWEAKAHEMKSEQVKEERNQQMQMGVPADELVEIPPSPEPSWLAANSGWLASVTLILAGLLLTIFVVRRMYSRMLPQPRG